MTEKWGLAVSGGGAKGAFAVGAIQHLMLDKRLQFDLVSGTSTGALIAPYVTAGKSKLAQLLNFYENVSNRDIIKKRFMLFAILRGQALNDTEPLKKLLEGSVGSPAFYRAVQKSKTEMWITTVDLQTGKLHYHTQGKISKERMLKAILASASMPVFMPAVKIGGLDHVDGGVKEISPLSILIERGVTHIVSITLSPKERARQDSDWNTIGTLKRTIDLFTQEIVDNDIGRAETINAGVKFSQQLRANAAALGLTPAQQKKLFAKAADPFGKYRVVKIYQIRPDEDLGESLEFDPAALKKMVDKGTRKAKKVFRSV